MKKFSFVCNVLLLCCCLVLSGCQTGGVENSGETSEVSDTSVISTTAATSDATSEAEGSAAMTSENIPADSTSSQKGDAAVKTTAATSKITTTATTKKTNAADVKPDPYKPEGLWDKYFWISTGNGHYGGTDEEMRRIIKNHKEMGFNCMERIRLSRDFLAICEEEEMYVTSGYFGEANGDATTRTEETTKEWAAKFADSKYFLGFIPWDEPAHDTNIFRHIHQQYEWYRKYDKERLFMVNLLPSYGAYKWAGNAFKQYIDDFNTIADLQILGVDYYPFDTNGNCNLDSTGMWADWGYCRKLCKEADKDLWLYIQGTGWGETDVGYWTKGRIAVQMNAAIAYGARRVSYWVSTPLYMDASGNKSSLFEDGKDLHKRAMTTGSYLLGKTPDKLYLSGMSAAKKGMFFLDDEADSPLIASLPSGPSIVSTFTDNTQRTYMVIVNRSYDRVLSDSVSLKGTHHVKKLDPLTGKELVIGNVSKLPVQLEEGDMVLYVIE